MFSPNPIPRQYGVSIRLPKQHFERRKRWLIWHRTVFISFNIYISKSILNANDIPQPGVPCSVFRAFFILLFNPVRWFRVYLLILREGGVSMLYQGPQSARACAVIKTTSKSITVQPLRLLPSRHCKGIFLPGNCGGWLQLVPGAKRGVRGGAVQADWIFCRVGELHKVLSPSGDFFWHLSYSAPLNTGCWGWQPAQVQVSRGTLLHRSQSSFTDWTQAAELQEEDRMKVEREWEGGVGSLICPRHGAGQLSSGGQRNFHYFHWMSHNWWCFCEFSSLRDWEVGKSKAPYFLCNLT